MQNYQHRMLVGMEESGFGVKHEDNLSAYTPPHWHKAVELLLFVKGRVTCNFENAKIHFKPGDMFIINSHEVHETNCSRNADNAPPRAILILVVYSPVSITYRYL